MNQNERKTHLSSYLYRTDGHIQYGYLESVEKAEKDRDYGT